MGGPPAFPNSEPTKGGIKALRSPDATRPRVARQPCFRGAMVRPFFPWYFLST